MFFTTYTSQLTVFKMKILVTGGAGFIGSNFIRLLLGSENRGKYRVVNLDKLTYAGNLENLADLPVSENYRFVRGDIGDVKLVQPLVAEVDAIVNFAAETHVDRSLLEPGSFIVTDVYGTYVLLEAARQSGVQKLVQVSTDEVYGSVETGSSCEIDRLDPRSPYSASKAGGDLMVRAYFTSYGLPVCVTRGSNTYGPYQYPEKLIPLFVTNAIDDMPLPIYGDGKNIRDWLYVEDHCAGIDAVLHRGEPGEIYNIGGGNERNNLEITERILNGLGKPWSLVKYVTDRPGHDWRYALSIDKIERELGWRPRVDLEEGLRRTLSWYLDHQDWLERVRSGAYRDYLRRQYGAAVV